MSTHYDTFLIGGRWTAPSSSEEIVVVSPNDERRLGTVAAGVHADIDAAVAAARAAFDAPGGWPQWPADKRAAAMETLADALDRRSEQIAQAVSSQNGMPVAIAGQLEAVFPQVLLRYYAQLACAEEFSTERPGLLGGHTTVTRTPVGVVGAIVPWNFPQVLSAFKYAPGLAAGCTFVIKPAPETVFDAVLFAEAVAESDIPPGVINVVPGGRETGAYLVSHPGIDKVAFTGSTQVGREIATVCGGLLRPVTLELGGKSAAIILDDADLDLSVIGEKLFAATLLNNGQTCFIGTRILAPRSRYAEVVDVITALAGSLTVGSSLDPATQIGPLVSARQRDRVEAAIAAAASSGARLTTGGTRPLDTGWFVAPTVFADVSNDSAIAREEIFGPVLAVIGYDDDEDAVRIANANAYGLGGSVWTTDPQRGMAVAKGVRSGTVGINHYLPDPTAPFGGVKASGLGRELGPEGLAAYLETKSIYQPAG
ncbi:acyl-CoA reductase-like NAD-dependent aldehyde dehydrogenase [Mycolicibacterium sp. BK556]|uniref:aldehyde dehydrogenase n=1 Tax=unclassified Mycolicibacterium TaxID=2636767 RepID=UPI0016149D30|nr:MULTISPECIES: aldehyde dehydrogenase [unclassified Mycolicibacterium]MBB3603397.1 acyl-CoA reductase-like NAD-dependent aldehyde dehydrogenase [Mycolicibacterium sp. BK556]MBB3633592.1 acyl-CoA reductase-like NAD-dependent aldehyde dehydrogenase [Mycolicibacterium sp. BK607]